MGKLRYYFGCFWLLIAVVFFAINYAYGGRDMDGSGNIFFPSVGHEKRIFVDDVELENHSAVVQGSAKECGHESAPEQPCEDHQLCKHIGEFHVEKGCCWKISNSKFRAVLSSYPRPRWISVRALGAPAQDLPMSSGQLVELTSRSGGDHRCVVAGSNSEVLSLTLRLRCGDMEGDFTARLRDGDSHYLRTNIKMWTLPCAKHLGNDIQELTLFTVGPGIVKETRGDATRFGFDEPLDGVPFLMNSRFFIGVEHPMAKTRILKSGHQTAVVSGTLEHMSRLSRPTEQTPWSYGAVFGTFDEELQARRAFVQYLHAVRPGRRTPMVHYNSWYDFYSYQDEGFNGGFKDPVKDPDLIASLRPDKLSEASCIQRVEAFGEALVRKRHTVIDSFLWDDGWDDPNSLWKFDPKRFPHDFRNVTLKAASYGAGTGVWISPWGGYGFPQEMRVKYGKAHGWEVNVNERLQAEAFSLAGPRYRQAFHDLAVGFVRDHGVNMFKFDGVAGDPSELAEEMESMLKLLVDLRDATARRHADQAGTDRHEDKNLGQGQDDDIWINLTTGTWASPFFLLWADSIWRGASDIPSRPRDWTSENTGEPLTNRQMWIRWRNKVVYALVVSQSTFFPLSQLMIHGVVVGSHGDALHWQLDKYDAVDFAQEVWSFVGLGLQLQELYVAPRYMNDQAWDILAEGLQWARKHSHVLQDSHWAFGDPTKHQVYATAAWDIELGKGFVFMHNAAGVLKFSEPFSLVGLLELPSVIADRRLDISVVKSIAKANPGWSCSRISQADGTDLKHSSNKNNCSALGKQKISLKLWPSEVLVIAVSLPTELVAV